MIEWKKANQRKAFGEVLVELGKECNDLVALTADLSTSTRTSEFEKSYPSRFFNFGVAEQNMFTTAAGLALSNKIVIASTFAVFASGRALDQIRQSIAYQNLNVKIVATHGGVTVGADGASHQCIDDLGIMTTLPNMKVVVPCDAIETKKAVRACINAQGPFYIRLGREDVPTVTKGDDKFELGKGNVLKDGKDIALIATGIMVSKCLIAAQELAERGINAKVINIHTIKPIDRALIKKVAEETNLIITAEEHSIFNGLGAMVSYVVCEDKPVRVERIGIPDVFGESGSAEELMEKYGLSAENIVDKAVKLMKEKRES
ncbi:MAG: transketolase family protein [Candidatus Thermoplasmatota archaeon]|nr:transketolase family protein [Candidatus Thermoplasmatota archaeon]MDI6887407.1 transketolase family protein [Candidatus Thermoplasmatota archaeon]